MIKKINAEKNKCFTNLEPGLDIVPQLVSVDGDVVLGHPVGVQDRAAEGLLHVQTREVLLCDL